MRLKYQKTILFKEEALNMLAAYAWPGNYRELKNTIEVLFLTNQLRISINDLPSWVKSDRVSLPAENNDQSYYDSVAQFELDFFYSLLERNDGKINQSAQVAGISKVTLISKLKKYGINRRQFKKEIKMVAG